MEKNQKRKNFWRACAMRDLPRLAPRPRSFDVAHDNKRGKSEASKNSLLLPKVDAKSEDVVLLVRMARFRSTSKRLSSIVHP
jgi:hypothetical protein